MKNLKLIGIKKSFGRTEIVKGIDLTITEGEILALVGESGCGKTTVMRMIAGLEEVTEGKIQLREDDITDVKPQKRKVGMVFQNLALFPHMTVYQNIVFGCVEVNDSKIKELLKLTGLNDLKERYPHELSGGQQQRVALARTLASDPEILLLDEPFSNLDELTRERVRTEIIQLIKSLGITTIIVTHHPVDAFMMADQVALMRDGKILQVGKPEEVYERPESDYTATFLGASVLIPARKDGDRAETPFGTLDMEIGADGMLFTRPENFSLSKSEGQLAGVVTNKLFSGPHEIIAIRSGDGEHQLFIETEHSDFKSGDQIYLTPERNSLIELKKIL